MPVTFTKLFITTRQSFQSPESREVAVFPQEMPVTQFINCRQCINGTLTSPSTLTISSTGIILPSDHDLPPDTQIVDLRHAIVAPGFLELQINGALGFHFAHVKPPAEYAAGVLKLAQHLPSTGVTGFYPTVPTVASDVFRRVLPFLKPWNDGGEEDLGREGKASVLGAHVEGPFLAPSKKGAHDAANMHIPMTTSLEDVYGKENLVDTIRVVTLAPELPGALDHIKTLTEGYGINVAMGHSAATHKEGAAALKAGAKLLTHTFNAMNPLNHREPGLPGESCPLSPSPPPWPGPSLCLECARDNYDEDSTNISIKIRPNLLFLPSLLLPHCRRDPPSPPSCCHCIPYLANPLHPRDR